VWAALRTLDAVGVQYCDIIINQERYRSKLRAGHMTAAMGTQKWMSLRSHQSTESCLQGLRDAGYRIAVTDIHHPNSVPITAVDFTKGKTVIVLGNEENGATEAARRAADVHFYVDMKGFAESLNVSAFCAYLCGRLSETTALDATREHAALTPCERGRILLTWLARTMPEAAMARLAEAGVEGIPTVGGAVGGAVPGAGAGAGAGEPWDLIAGFTTQP